MDNFSTFYYSDSIKLLSMKTCKCTKCGHIQNYDLLDCQKCRVEMSTDVCKEKKTAKIKTKKTIKKQNNSNIIMVFAYIAAILGGFGIFNYINNKNWELGNLAFQFGNLFFPVVMLIWGIYTIKGNRK